MPGDRDPAPGGGVPAGTVDLNVHYGPDLVARNQTAVAAVRSAERLGLSAICLRTHHGSSVDLANALGETSTVAVHGATTMGAATGGVNPAAADAAARTGARIVSLPTSYARAASTATGASPAVPVLDGDGRPTPATHELFDVVAAGDLTLDLGVLPEASVLTVLRCAREHGVERVVISHPFFPAQNYDVDLQAAAARAGAVIEHCYAQFDPGYPRVVPVESLVGAIRAAGTDRVVLSSDSGRADLPALGDALNAMHRMLAPFFTAEEMDRMCRANPTSLIGPP